MHCPTLEELPAPPAGKRGWPWTAESAQLPETLPDGISWPKITIVTPSYNQADFLEATIRSVLLQGYPNLEYIVIDGASTDSSVGVIRKYEPWLAYWLSEADHGQYHAINKGFEKSSGSVMAWLNSDDMYAMNSFKTVGTIFKHFEPTVSWITGLSAYWDEQGTLFNIKSHPLYSSQLIRLGYYDERGFGVIQQESTFWRRDLWQLAGGNLDQRLQFAADFDLWRRFANYADLYLVTTLLGGFRVHRWQKTFSLDEYFREVDSCLAQSRVTRWSNLRMKNRIGKIIFRIYQRLKQDYRAVDYNPRAERWEIQ